MNQPRLIAITMGDASGIGPEIIAKMLAKGREQAIVYGSYAVMMDVVHRRGLGLEVRTAADPRAVEPNPGVINVIEVTQIIEPPPLGQISAVSGQASFDAIVA